MSKFTASLAEECKQGRWKERGDKQMNNMRSFSVLFRARGFEAVYTGVFFALETRNICVCLLPSLPTYLL